MRCHVNWQKYGHCFLLNLPKGITTAMTLSALALALVLVQGAVLEVMTL